MSIHGAEQRNNKGKKRGRVEERKWKVVAQLSIDGDVSLGNQSDVWALLQREKTDCVTRGLRSRCLSVVSRLVFCVCVCVC